MSYIDRTFTKSMCVVWCSEAIDSFTWILHNCIATYVMKHFPNTKIPTWIDIEVLVYIASTYA